MDSSSNHSTISSKSSSTSSGSSSSSGSNNNTPPTRQPTWHKPAGEPLTDLKIYNSLSQSKVPFIAQDGRHVTWYVCGPTVYDASHMGHARNYIGFDILRRIMSDYFKYDVTWVMNITDIDDKIIIRSREQNRPNFTDLPREWEKDFLDDMRALQVQPPDVLTRVTEYVPQIIAFVSRIIENKLAYESNGSVYFDTVAFSQRHFYAKLCPHAVGDSKLMAEGEGALSAGAGEKKSASDFALWKKSKEGEPKWPSPWGEGRPGWHIECSAMAGDILGATIDIHSGGEDLRFPHHDNELAQSEAYFGTQQWVNYFIHSGHLHINGCKMSKSLKNFITIKQALEKYTARQLRVLFLLHKFDNIMDYSPDTMTHALETEKTFSEFFHAVKNILRNHKTADVQHWTARDKELHSFLVQTRKSVHNCLADNFDTPGAMQHLAELVKKSNIYLAPQQLQQQEQPSPPKAYLLQTIADYITSMFKIFGLIDTHSTIGFSSSTEGSNAETVLGPVLDVLTQFRGKVRESAKKKELGQVLEACDLVRDESLPLVGVRLDDLPDGTTRWKLDDKEVLLKELEQRRELAARKQQEKEARVRKEQEKLEAAKLSPKDLFAAQKDKYKQFDDQGMPTHDAEGQPLTKSALKTVTKQWQAQAKLHETWLKQQQQPQQ